LSTQPARWGFSRGLDALLSGTRPGLRGGVRSQRSSCATVTSWLSLGPQTTSSILAVVARRPTAPQGILAKRPCPQGDGFEETRRAHLDAAPTPIGLHDGYPAAAGWHSARLVTSPSILYPSLAVCRACSWCHGRQSTERGRASRLRPDTEFRSCAVQDLALLSRSRGRSHHGW
jgi:hypothetical protein